MSGSSGILSVRWGSLDLAVRRWKGCGGFWGGGGKIRSSEKMNESASSMHCEYRGAWMMLGSYWNTRGQWFWKRGPAASAPPDPLLEMHVLGPTPDLQPQKLSKPSGWFWCGLEEKSHWSRWKKMDLATAWPQGTEREREREGPGSRSRATPWLGRRAWWAAEPQRQREVSRFLSLLLGKDMSLQPLGGFKCILALLKTLPTVHQWSPLN